MSLYDDFDDVGKSKLQKSGLIPSINLMQSHVINLRRNAKRLSQQIIQPKLAPVVDLKKTGNEGEFRFNHVTGKMEKCPQGSSGYDELNQMAFEDPLLRLGFKDEYNPLYPNDYEDVSKMMKEKRKLEDLKREEDLRKSESKYAKFDITDDDSDNEQEHVDQPRMGTAIAPPPSLLADTTIITNIELPKEIQEMLNPEDHKLNDVVAATQAKYGTTSAAAKIMVKMGFKHGQGLGKEGQGMSTALQVERTSRRGGKIIHEKDLVQQQPFAQSRQSLPERVSNVVLLRNMVGPGEVDDDLQPETAEECSKYGQVVTCMIFELQDVPEEQAVRIFVEFVDKESAYRAVNDLNKRFFGGRVVSAGYYDSEKFKNLELAEESWNIVE